MKPIDIAERAVAVAESIIECWPIRPVLAAVSRRREARLRAIFGEGPLDPSDRGIYPPPAPRRRDCA
jgi:hypothetical protein